MRIEDELKYTIQLGQGPDNPILILRQPTPAEVKAFLTGRFVRKGTKVQDESVTARERFIDTLLISVLHVEVKDPSGNYVALNPDFPNWQEKIPVNWKTSIAVHFEEREIVNPDEAGESLASSAN